MFIFQATATTSAQDRMGDFLRLASTPPKNKGQLDNVLAELYKIRDDLRGDSQKYQVVNYFTVSLQALRDSPSLKSDVSEFYGKMQGWLQGKGYSAQQASTGKEFYKDRKADKTGMEGQLRSTMNSMQVGLMQLDAFADFDDLGKLETMRKGLVDGKASLDQKVRDMGSTQADADAWVKEQFKAGRAMLSPYLMDVISEDGTFSVDRLNTKVNSMVGMSKAMYVLETDLNNLMKQEKHDPALEQSIRRQASELLSYDRQTLDRLASLRYGSDGNLLVNAAVALGLVVQLPGKEATLQNLRGSTLGEKYAYLISDMADAGKVSQSNYDALIQGAKNGYADAYKALTTLPRNVIVPNEAVPLAADAFDPFSRIAFFSLVQRGQLPSVIAQPDAAGMVSAAQYMPAGTAGLVLGDAKFFSALGMVRAQNRLEVFTAATSLVSATYAVSSEKGNYDVAVELMGIFSGRQGGGMPVAGNLVTDIEQSDFRMSNLGSISINPINQDSFRFDYVPGMLPTSNFVAGMIYPMSLSRTWMPPQLAPNQQMQATDTRAGVDRQRQEHLRAFDSMPSTAALDFIYSGNPADRRNTYTNIVAWMRDAQAGLVGRNLESWLGSATGGSAALQGSKSDWPNQHGAFDAQANVAGARAGQSGAAEYFHRKDWLGNSTVGRDYFDLNATNMRALGMNVINAFGQGDWSNIVAEAAGTKTTQRYSALNTFLNTTFPGKPDGTIIASFNQTGSGTKVESAAGATDASKSYYIGDVFVKRKGGWSHAIASRDFDAFLDTNTGSGKLRDAVEHYFDQTYLSLGKLTVLDVAGEYNRYTYQKTESPFFRSTDQFGALVIAQPGIKAAFGGARTAWGDYAVVGGYDNMKSGKDKKGNDSNEKGDRGYLFSGGFYALDPRLMPKVTSGGLTYEGRNYYEPSFRLYEPLYEGTKNKTYMTRFTWMGINRFRSTVLGGWKSEGGGIFGQEYVRKNAHVSTFVNLDKDGKLASGIGSAGGRFFGGRTSVSATVLKPEADYDIYGTGKTQVQAVVSTKIGGPASKNSGTLTVTGSVNRNWMGAKTLEPSSQLWLANQATALESKYGSINLSDLEDRQARNALMGKFGEDVISLVNNSIEFRPGTDLQRGVETSLAVSYNGTVAGREGKTRTVGASFGVAQLESGRTMLMGMVDLNKRFSIMGGYSVGPAGKEEEYRGVFGIAAKPWERTKFALLVTETEGKKAIATFNAQYRWAKGISGMSVSAGDRIFTAHAFVGNERISGMVNFGKVDDATYGQIGGNMLLGAATHLALAYTYAQLANQEQGGKATPVPDLDLRSPLAAAGGQYYTGNLSAHYLKMDFSQAIDKRRNIFLHITGMMAMPVGAGKSTTNYYVGAGVTFGGFGFSGLGR